jgi:hypothetical protein
MYIYMKEFRMSQKNQKNQKEIKSFISAQEGCDYDGNEDGLFKDAMLYQEDVKMSRSSMFPKSISHSTPLTSSTYLHAQIIPKGAVPQTTKAIPTRTFNGTTNYNRILELQGILLPKLSHSK